MSFQNKLLYENIVRDGAEGCKRHKLAGKKYFGGLYEGSERNENLWLEVQQYIYDNYDTEYLEKSKFVLDQYDNMIWGNIFTRQPHI